jgi:hypothetical protein
MGVGVGTIYRVALDGSETQHVPSSGTTGAGWDARAGGTYKPKVLSQAVHLFPTAFFVQ